MRISFNDDENSNADLSLFEKVSQFNNAIFCAALWFVFGQIVLLNQIVDLLSGFTCNN